MKKLHTIRIEDYLFPNYGVGYFEGKEVRIKNTLPGQLVNVKLGKERSGFRVAKAVEVLEESPLEKNSFTCKYYENCGGCNYQALTLCDEIELKRSGLRKLFKDHGYDIVPTFTLNPKTFYYRNKMEYSFGDSVKGGPLVLGLHRKNRYYEIIDNIDCNIVHPDFETIRIAVMEYFRDKKTAHYRKMTKEGFLRNLVVRYSYRRKEIMINLVTTSQEDLDKDGFIKLLKSLKLEGEIVSILQTINDSDADAVICDELRVLEGRDYIVEEILGLSFKIYPFSFFQPNVFGIENLYSRVKEYIEDSHTVFDLYSGTGTISQIIADKVEKVVAVEIVEEAVKAAEENAKINGLENIDFIASDVLKVLDSLEGNPDTIILDPPRGGINPKALGQILDFKPNKFIYISCNPTQLANDLGEFIKRGYKMEKIEFFDQFTRTCHTEALTLLTRG